jgi:hypothetical protein
VLVVLPKEGDMPASLAGIELARHPSDPALLLHRPASIPDHWREALRRHRVLILSLLTTGYNPDDESEFDVYVERLGIADDLGMSTLPGAPAWLIAVGEYMKYSCTKGTNTVESHYDDCDGSTSACGSRLR